ncbi:hypothetical protein B0H13DRAFT_2381058 [Mycena leptocephala]|nr:hypothetical protein B0H13DRAFT_2381058 [Mycena leptocephala]
MSSRRPRDIDPTSNDHSNDSSVDWVRISVSMSMHEARARPWGRYASLRDWDLSCPSFSPVLTLYHSTEMFYNYRSSSSPRAHPWRRRVLSTKTQRTQPIPSHTRVLARLPPPPAPGGYYAKSKYSAPSASSTTSASKSTSSSSASASMSASRSSTPERTGTGTGTRTPPSSPLALNLYRVHLNIQASRLCERTKVHIRAPAYDSRLLHGTLAAGCFRSIFGFTAKPYLHTSNFLNALCPAIGQFTKKIAFLQTGRCGGFGGLPGNGCGLVETTLVNPSTDGSNSSTAIDLIFPQLPFQCGPGFEYFNGFDGQGANCTNDGCPGALHLPTDTAPIITCDADNVNLAISFCALTSTSGQHLTTAITWDGCGHFEYRVGTPEYHFGPYSGLVVVDK